MKTSSLENRRKRARELHGRGEAVDAIASRVGMSLAETLEALASPGLIRSQLAAVRRNLWAARRREGMSIAHIARRSGVSESAVRQGLAKAAALAAGGEG